MERNIKTSTRATIAGLLLFSLTPFVLAQDDGSDRKTKQTVAMSQQVYEQLTEVQEFVEAGNYAGAEGVIREMRANEKLSPYERAQVWNLSGYSYYLQERYPEAINAYEQVLAQPELPEALQLSTLKTMAQLQFTVEDYKGALDTVHRLMAAVPEPSADVYMLEGQALFQMGDYKAALNPIKTAVDMFREQGQVPRENWLLLLRVIYFELKDYDSMIAVVKELIQHYPKETYVLTLAGVYSELGDTKKQLALTEVLYEMGYLNSASHITNLANLYLLHGIPYKAAQVLDKGIKEKIVEPDERNLRLLSQAWYQAREDDQAIPPLRMAAEMSEDGELWVRLAQSHINLEQWKDAASAANEALSRGGLKRNDQAQIMLGMALFNQKLLEQARVAFENARRDQRSARAAEQWIAYVDSELRRQELMDQEVEYKERERDALLDATMEQE
ncbi:MAG TPA: tetratricopeptide repeat protein [Xanthomonadales bacterium]|nr:tetratricopeptide repeat protein [Xanthomonadales bacterium]